MANLIKQKFLEGIDSSKFKIEQGGAIKAVNSSGQLVEVFKFDAVNEVVKVFGDEEVAVSSYVDSLMAQEVTARNAAINDAITALINGAPEALDTLKELADSLANDPNAVNSLINQITQEATTREQADQAIQDQIDGLTSDLSDYIKHDGTVAFSGDVDMGSHKISNLSNGMVPTDAVNKGQLDSGVQEAKDYTDNLEDRALLLNGSQMMGAALQMNSNKIEGVANGMVPTDAVNKGQLDSGIQESKDYTDNLEDRALLLNGSQMMGAALQMNFNKIEGLSNGMVPTDAVNKGQLDSGVQEAKDHTDNLEDRVMLLNGSQSMTAALQMNSNKIEGLSNGMVPTDAVNKGQLDSAIQDEASTRQQADSNLQSQIDTEKGRVDAILLAADADKDSFAEIVTLINSIDASNDESLAGHLVATSDAHDASAISFVNTASGMVATDVQAALDELQSQHDDLDGYAQEIRSDLDQEISNRIADVDAEETRALAAEQVLQDAISAEATARAADVDAEETRAMAAEQALQNAIDAEAQARSDEDATMLKLDGSRSMTGFLKFDLTGQNLDLANSHSEISSSGIEYVRVGLTGSDVSNNVTLNRELGFANFITVPNTEVDNGDGTFTTTYDGYFKRAKLSYNDGFELKHTSKSYDGQYDVTNESTINTGSLLLKQNSVNSDGTGFGDDINTVSIDPWMIAFSNSVGNKSMNIGFTPMDNIAYIDVSHNSLYINNSAGSLSLNSQSSTVSLYGLTGIRFNSEAKTMNPVVLYAEGSYDEDNNYLGDIPAVPTDAMHAVNKAYVDSQISGNKTFEKESFTIDTTSELSYVDLAHTPIENSLVVFVNRLAVHEGVDYSVSVVDGVTRLTWTGDFAVGQIEEIETGDVIRVVYMR